MKMGSYSLERNQDLRISPLWQFDANRTGADVGELEPRSNAAAAVIMSLNPRIDDTDTHLLEIPVPPLK
jgi:hypothetical protein